ncbi:hypothetical protein ALC60_08731, partial [Trachymyrmex zeteki]
NSSERRELDFAKLSNFSCSQSSGPRYLNGFILENFCKFVPLESLKRIPWIR